MKKITRLSLVACMAFTSNMYADSLEEAFTNSKVKGELKAQYFDVQPLSDGKSDRIMVVGGNLNFLTGSFYGFKSGVTFQATHVVEMGTKNANNFAATMDASGAVMSEVYLQYSLSNTTAKVGRQYITTKLVAGSGSRMIKQSFEGVTVLNKDIPDTIIGLAYVDKYQNRTDMNGKPGEFKQFEDGAWTIHAQNNSVENLTLKAQYLDVKGAKDNSDKDAIYLEAAYDFGVVNLAAQYLDSSNGDMDGNLFGLKASGNVGMVNLTGIYTTTGDDGTAYNGVGSGADPSFSALPLHGGSITYTKDTDTMVGIVGTKISGVTLVGYYGHVDTGDKALPYEEVDAFGGFVQYAFNKNFSAKVMYESADFDTSKHDDNVFRIYTSYKF